MNRRQRITGKGRINQFFAFPHSIINDERFSLLSARAVKLLVDLGGQYNGGNNGHLMATWSFLHRKRGWKSKDSLYKARSELIDAGLIMITRYGGKHVPTLYALTFQAIDKKDRVRLHVKTTTAPPGAWKKSHEYEDASLNAMFH